MNDTQTTTSTTSTTPTTSTADRLRHFGEAIDAIRHRIEAEIGDDDVRYVRRLDAFSRAMEVVGRTLLHFSVEPVGFFAGVGALFLHKQLQATEIGHMALHGAWDDLPGAERYASKTFRWDLPIDEASWRTGHNIKHHQYTNVAGRDPDIHFGTVRLTRHTPHRYYHRVQIVTALAFTFPNFALYMNMHFTGLIDVYFGNGRADELDVLPDRSVESVARAHGRALRKAIPYALRNYVLFPALAGPGFLKVLAGNWLAERARDIYSAATIYCGHVGDDVAAHPEGTRAHGRGEWYAMQVEATNNFEVALPLSILCGALDRQIEHHLFPRLPPNRLRQIAPEVRAACERFGVNYKTAGWGATLRKAFRHLRTLSRPEPVA